MVNLKPQGRWNTVCTHRIKVEQESDINKDVLKWIKQAYEQAG
jgi:hypothetical protein